MKAKLKGILTRNLYQDKQTLGTLEMFDDKSKKLFECFTLELADLNNQPQHSCIPKGTYDVVIRTSPKFGLHFHVTNVKNRDLILIHFGNYFTDILGCILVGDGLKLINSDHYKDVTNSKVTLQKLLKIAPEGFELTIR
jgi:Family of unknown function (DUF5675)